MADDNSKGNSPDWGAITKWLVLGVIALVLIFVLRQPLVTVVGGAQDIIINKNGVEIHTAKTAVGEVKYSQEKIKTDDVARLEQADANTKVFVSNNHYVLAWPKDSWKKNDEQLQYLNDNYSSAGYRFDMYCTRLMPSKSNFTPNVTVLIGPSDGSTMAQILKTYKDQFLNNVKATIVNEKIDETTNGGLLVYTRFDNVYSQKELYQIQRFVSSNGKQYILTATTTTDDDEETKKELLSILNSFRIVEG
jgi:hypothetical protein